jgi:LEA14-like dessication related protein
MQRLTTRTMLPALMALALSACAARMQQPEVWLEGARLASLGLSGGVVNVRLSVHNPNRFGVTARGLTYDLEVRDAAGTGWIPFTDGRLDHELRIGGRDTLEVEVPVAFSYEGLGGAIRSLMDHGAFDYRVSGVVELKGLVRRQIPYQYMGRYVPD